MAGDDNAGVFVGFPDPGNDPFNAVNEGHEIQIDATDDPSHTTGAIYDFQAAEAAARDAALKPPGRVERVRDRRASATGSRCSSTAPRSTTTSTPIRTG